VFHDDEGRPVFQPRDIENAAHVLALDAGRSARLEHEPSHERLVGAQLTSNHLDGYQATQVKVACSQDHSHPTLAQNRLDAVLPDQCIACRDGGRHPSLHWTMPYSAQGPRSFPVVKAGDGRGARGRRPVPRFD
jgi:hypothetical protein